MRLGLVLFIAGIFFTSCEKREVVVSRDLKRQVDTLYRNERNALIPKLDSLCSIQKVARYDHLLDSVIAVRKQERDQILGR